MVQEKIRSNQSAVDVPKCKYTPRFNKGPGDLTPKFHKHQPLARSPTSTVTSTARALSAHHTRQMSGDGCGSWACYDGLLSSSSEQRL